GSAGIRTILHVGDFGIWSGVEGRAFLNSVDLWCERVGIERILVTPGNHEDWGWLDEDFDLMPGEPVPVSPRVAALPRGFRFTISGVAFLSFGGAASVDYELRRAGVDWFPSEAPTDDDVA